MPHRLALGHMHLDGCDRMQWCGMVSAVAWNRMQWCGMVYAMVWKRKERCQQTCRWGAYMLMACDGME
eukprot:8842-Rhodomonas_salina.1